ncbi:hypothetical protein K1719_026649 [Acacia pycnantha]|nr:hypothetical protein K1719_026649 [Acacia pycnantha]
MEKTDLNRISSHDDIKTRSVKFSKMDWIVRWGCELFTSLKNSSSFLSCFFINIIVTPANFKDEFMMSLSSLS